MQRNSKPLAWRPKGVSDTIDASQAFDGSMVSLQNMVPDPSTKGLFQCRPAAIPRVGFTGSAFSSGFSSGFGSPFQNAGFISVERVFGDYVYGMVATSRTPGHDEPFVFNLITNQFITVAGVTANNVPVSPAISGAWIPPQIEMIGSKVCVTHQGFSGAFGAYFGYFDILNPAAPVWNGANCSGANFPTFLVAPTGIAQFSNRAYFLHNYIPQPAVIFSDILSPTTNSSGAIVPILTFNDTEQLTAIAGMPLSTTFGGIIQSLMVFKGVRNIYQVNGDPFGSTTITINTLNVPTGTLAPRSVVSTPVGLAFMSPDGLRIINFSAQVGPIIGDDGQGISTPFIYTNVPSRIAAGANGTIIRITTQNAQVAGTPWQEYWYDLARQAWTGPHTSTCTCYSTYQNTFIVVPEVATGTLAQSDYEQSITSTFVEYGSPLTFTYATSFLPDTDQMTNNAMTMTTLDMGLAAAGGPVSVTVSNQNGIVLDTVSIVPTGTIPLWGAVTWGTFNWGGTQSELAPRILPWHHNIDFVKLQLGATGTSVAGLKIGTMHARYKILRFLSNIGAVT